MSTTSSRAGASRRRRRTVSAAAAVVGSALHTQKRTRTACELRLPLPAPLPRHTNKVGSQLLHQLSGSFPHQNNQRNHIKSVCGAHLHHYFHALAHRWGRLSSPIESVEAAARVAGSGDWETKQNKISIRR